MSDTIYSTLHQNYFCTWCMFLSIVNPGIYILGITMIESVYIWVLYEQHHTSAALHCIVYTTHTAQHTYQLQLYSVSSYYHCFIFNQPVICLYVWRVTIYYKTFTFGVCFFTLTNVKLQQIYWRRGTLKNLCVQLYCYCTWQHLNFVTIVITVA